MKTRRWTTTNPTDDWLKQQNILTNTRSKILWPIYLNISKVVPYSITSVGHGADPGFLVVSPQVTLVIYPVVGCRYFPSGPRLPSQPKRSPPWPVPNYIAWWQRHTGVSSLSKATSHYAMVPSQDSNLRPVHALPITPPRHLNITW